MSHTVSGKNNTNCFRAELASSSVDWIRILLPQVTVIVSLIIFVGSCDRSVCHCLYGHVILCQCGMLPCARKSDMLEFVVKFL